MTSQTSIETPEMGLRSWLTALVATLGTWAYSFTWNTVGVALPNMKGTFSANNDQIAWIMIAFIVGSAMMTASIGWLSGRFGRKELFLFSIIGFTLSLIGCGSATTLEMEVFWRFIQGLTGAPLIALGQIIAVNAFPPEKYSMATSLWALGFVTGNVVAPTIGGVLIEYYGWPSIFYINIPLCILIAISAVLLLPKSQKIKEKLDWFGCFTLIAGVALLQFIMARGERLDWFESGEVIFIGIVSTLLIYMFIVHTTTGKNTFFSKDLFKNYNFTVGQITIFVIGAAIYMPLLLLPLMLQQISGFPPIEVGQLLLSRGAGSVIGLIAMSQLRERIDPRPLMVFGLICNIIPSWEMAHWSTEIVSSEVIWTNFLAGVGVGFVWAPLNRMVLSKLEGKLQDQGFAMFYLNFDIGYAIGTSAIIALHSRYSQINHALLSENIMPFNESFRSSMISGGWSIYEPNNLMTLQSEITRQAAMISYNNSFLISTWILIALIPLAYCFKNTWSK